MAIMQEVARNYKKTAIVLDRVVLVEQTSLRLGKYNIDHGVIQRDHWRYRPDLPIQVCSAQTLEKREIVPDIDLLIIDECHVQRRGIVELIKNNPQLKVIGLTATPFTNGLGNVYTNVVGALPTGELIDKGWLTPLKVFIAKEIDMTGAKKVAGEWSADEVAERGMKITGDIVSEWIKKTHEIYDKPMKTIVFCSGVNHGRDLEEKFKQEGYNFVSISYKEDDEFKRTVIEDFGRPDTEINGLIATDILTRGFDVSDVCIGVSARPFSKSFSSHVQQLGRVMRPHQGKEFAVWLDHSGNYLRFRDDWDKLYDHGVDELKEGTEKSRKEPTVKEKKESMCPSCGGLWTSPTNICDECGFERQNPRDIINVPGELTELDVANRKLVIDNQQFYSEILYYSRSKGYNDGWVAHKYKEKFGVWPRGLKQDPLPPSIATSKWIKSRLIAYAKGKSK
jgi:superfamily II DNA or RNA helicase